VRLCDGAIAAVGFELGGTGVHNSVVVYACASASRTSRAGTAGSLRVEEVKGEGSHSPGASREPASS
jgi:hypothetical protein